MYLIANRAHFFTQPFARQRLFYALFLTRLQIERVLFDVFDDVFLLHLPFETPQRALKGFPFVQYDFRHQIHLPPAISNGKQSNICHDCSYVKTVKGSIFLKKINFF